MDGIVKILAEVLLELLRRCTSLVQLSVGCDINGYVAEVAPYMCKLHTFYSNALITDDALCMIAKHCTQLKRLGIMSEYKITENIVYENDEDLSPNMHCTFDDVGWSERMHTSKGFVALMGGLVHLELLGVRHEELEEKGLLNELAQSIWKRLRPKMVFTSSDTDFLYGILEHSII
eukprot:gene31778-35870_t